jgi:hypothetical protein
MNEYADYLQQLPRGQAGKLTIGEDEKHRVELHESTKPVVYKT